MTVGDPEFSIETTSNYYIVGISYAFFWWGLFALYCIGHQLGRIRVYYIRKQRVTGLEKKMDALPGSIFFHRLDYVVSIPFITEMIPVKHVIGVFVFIIINLLFIFFSPFKMQDGFGFILPPISVFDRRSAFVGMVNWGFVFFLAQRNSLLPKMSGLTFEELIPFHRIIARIGLAEFIPHFVWRIMQGYYKNHVVKDALFQDAEQTTGAIAMLGFLLIFASSFEYIRRNHFEVFYYCHIIGILIAIIFACCHESSCFAYFIPAIVLWFADRVVRSYKSWFSKTKSVHIDQIVPYTASQEGIFRVLFEHSSLRKFKPGQYIFASFVKKGRNVLEYANWHPFTISEVFRLGNDTGSIEERIIDTRSSSTVGDKSSGDTKNEKKALDNLSDMDSLSDTSTLRRRANALQGEETNVIASFHVKALGNKTQTLLTSAAANEELKIFVDGVYGPTLPYQDYETVALFATGIGATPAFAIIKDIVDKRSNGIRTMTVDHVFFIWAIRTTDEIEPFMDMLIYWSDRAKSAVLPLNLTINVYITRINEGTELFTSQHGCSTYYGKRPQVDEIMDKIQITNNTRTVWAHACGSTVFTRNVINQAILHNFTAQKETFEF